MSGSKTISTSATKLEALKLQSSAYGGTIPVVFGQTRIPGNLLWYGGFKAIPHTDTQEAGGKGGSTSVSNTTYTYQAALIMALSDTTLVEVVQHWRGKNVVPGLGSMLSLKTGALGQSIWSYLNTTFPSEALAYSGIAYVYSSAYDLGDTATVENHNFEVKATTAYAVDASTPDVDPSTVAVTMLTNTRYGVAFPSSKLPTPTRWSDFCVAAGLLMSPALTEQLPAAELLTQLCRLTNTGIVWSEDKLKFIPYADTTFTKYGRTYTPDITPVYDLTDDNFLDLENPVRVMRKPQADAYNHVQLEYLDRTNEYNVTVAEAKDQANIEAHGQRSSPILKAHWICDTATARQVAQLLLQRALYIRNTYEFRLPGNFALMEPMDLVTITDSALQFDKLPVRLTEIEEDPDGQLLCKAEDFPLGVANAALYDVDSPAGFQPNYNADPGSISAPVIFELPGEMAVNGLELGVAVTGLDPNWGGCTLWVSLDGSNYRQAGRMAGGSRYGTLYAALGTSGTVSVELLEGQLLSGSTEDAQALNTLCFLRNTVGAEEFISYKTATLSGTNRYVLSALVIRGAYATQVVSHAAGSTFVRLDQAVMRSGPIDLGYIGRTISIKLTSFNVFGGAEESLASVSAYTYTITGARLYGNAGAAAVAALGDIANDNLLTEVEKPPLILEYTRVVGEQAGIDAQATSYGITTEKTNYDSKLSTLASYLAGLTTPVAWNVLTGTTTIVGTTFRTRWADVYAARQTLLNKFDSSAKVLADAAQSAADLAQAAADAAQVDADAANAAIANITSDNVLSKGEKSQVIREYTDIINEQTDINTKATAYGVTSQLTNYNNEVTALTSYLSGLSPAWNNVSVDTPIVGSTFRTNFSDVYYRRQLLLNKMADLARTLAEAAQAAADAAQAAADAAQVDADAANAAIANITSDNVLAKGEKSQVIREYTDITNEQAGIDAQAVNYGVTTEKTNYDNAVSALTTYLSGLSPAWNTVTVDTPIVGTTFRAKFSDVYYRRQLCLDKVSANAKARLGALATIDQVDTGDIVDNAITRPLEVTVASKDINSTSGAEVTVCSIAFTAPADCSVELTVAGNALQESSSAEQYSCYGSIETSATVTASNDTRITRNPSSAILEDYKPLSLIKTYDMVSGQSYTFRFMALADLPKVAGRVAQVKNVVMRLRAFLK